MKGEFIIFFVISFLILGISSYAQPVAHLSVDRHRDKKLIVYKMVVTLKNSSGAAENEPLL